MIRILGSIVRALSCVVMGHELTKLGVFKTSDTSSWCSDSGGYEVFTLLRCTCCRKKVELRGIGG